MTPQELLSIRKKLGLTQQQLADLVGVARNSIARQERGEIGIREPLARLIHVLAKQKRTAAKKTSGRSREKR